MEEITLDNVKTVLEQYAKEVELILEGKLEEDRRRATGNLIDTLSVFVTSGNGVTYQVILNARPYLKYLETGTKPHWPPTVPILQWVRDKNLPTRENTGNKELPTEKQLTFLVRRKIAKVGTKANNYISKTVEECNAKYMQPLTDALSKDITENLRIIHQQLQL